jgi:hypothetical protein
MGGPHPDDHRITFIIVRNFQIMDLRKIGIQRPVPADGYFETARKWFYAVAAHRYLPRLNSD